MCQTLPHFIVVVWVVVHSAQWVGVKAGLVHTAVVAVQRAQVHLHAATMVCADHQADLDDLARGVLVCARAHRVGVLRGEVGQARSCPKAQDQLQKLAYESRRQEF
jgi:hypothetical protein